MTVADEQIAIRVEVEGAEKGARDLGSLADKVKGLEAASRKGAREVTRLERALERERAAAGTTTQSVNRLTAAEQRHAQSVQASGRSMTEASVSTGRLVSAFGSMGSAMTLLSPSASRLGGAMSAVGSSIAMTTANMGPLGIVLGAVTLALGLAVPALAAMRSETDDLGDSATATTRKLSTMAGMMQRIQRIQAVISLEQALSRGEATQLQHQAAGAVQREALAGAPVAGHPLTASRTRLSDLESELATAEQQLNAAMAGADQGGLANDPSGRGLEVTQRRRRLRRRVAGLRRGAEEARQAVAGDIGQARAEALRHEDLGRVQQVAEVVVIGSAGRRRRGGGRRGGGRRGGRGGRRMTELERLDAGKRRRDEIVVQEQEKRRAVFLAEVSDLEQREAAEEAFHEAQMQRLDAEKQKRDELHAAEMAQQQETIGKFSEAGAEVGGFFTDIYGQMVGDQKTFEEAFIASFKRLMIEKGSEAVFDGTKMVFEGIGMIMNPATSAEGGTKIAAGAGMIALGVAAGAAGAAISVPGGGGAPESPRAGGEAGGGGDKTIVLNMNGPLLTAQSEAGVGRSVQRSLRQAERVYGSAA